MSTNRTTACFVAVFLSMIVLPSARAQTFIPTDSMHFARTAHQATLLLDGRVLVSGGWDNSGGPGVAQAEIYDPARGTWSLAGANVVPRLEHTATLLQDGRVLVVGGVDNYYHCTSSTSAETYDPGTDTWSLTGSLPAPVGSGLIAVRLFDGRVLVSGGGNRCGGVYWSSAIFDPSTETWSAAAHMTIPREFHSAILLPDGRVLVAGGAPGAPFDFVSSAEVFDPTLNTWTSIAGMSTPRATSCDNYVLTFLGRLETGAILAAGGATGSCSAGWRATVNTDLFNPGTMSWGATGPMNVARAFTTLTPLKDGTVLIAGGYGPGQVEEASAELFSAGKWSLTGSLNAARAAHTATLLTNGDVLIAGGGTLTGHIATAEIYHPAPFAECTVQLSRSSYGNGDDVVLSKLRIANNLSVPLAIELKMWLGVPGFSPVSLLNIGANGSLKLPVGFEYAPDPSTLFQVVPAHPRGAYELGCRGLDPVTGRLLAEGIGQFSIK